MTGSILASFEAGAPLCDVVSHFSDGDTTKVSIFHADWEPVTNLLAATTELSEYFVVLSELPASSCKPINFYGTYLKESFRRGGSGEISCDVAVMNVGGGFLEGLFREGEEDISPLQLKGRVMNKIQRNSVRIFERDSHGREYELEPYSCVMSGVLYYE
jgi:hypothetical protein